MPSIRPAIAVAYSHTTSCAPSDPLMSDLALVPLAEVELVRLVDDPHDLQVGRLGLDLGRDGQEHDGQDAGALLAGRLGDELLDPVGQADDVRAVGDEPELVAARAAPPAIAAASTSAGLSALSIATSSSVASASSRSSAMSTPASPVGTRPNAVSAE